MKLKTTKSLSKRLKISGTGKIMRVKAAKSHLLRNKSNRTKTSLMLAAVDIKRVKKLVPYL